MSDFDHYSKQVEDFIINFISLYTCTPDHIILSSAIDAIIGDWCMAQLNLAVTIDHTIGLPGYIKLEAQDHNNQLVRASMSLIQYASQPGKFTNIATICECGMEKHGFTNHSTWCPKSPETSK